MKNTNQNLDTTGRMAEAFLTLPRLSFAFVLLLIAVLALIHRTSYSNIVIIGTILVSLLFVTKVWWGSVRGASSPLASRLTLGGLVFLGGASYGVYDMIVSRGGWLNLIAILIPALLGTWMIHVGQRVRRAEGGTHRSSEA
jgi:hypothetical protein